MLSENSDTFNIKQQNMGLEDLWFLTDVLSSIVLLGLYPQSFMYESMLIVVQPSSVQVFDRLPNEHKYRRNITFYLARLQLITLGDSLYSN